MNKVIGWWLTNGLSQILRFLVPVPRGGTGEDSRTHRSWECSRGAELRGWGPGKASLGMERDHFALSPPCMGIPGKGVPAQEWALIVPLLPCPRPSLELRLLGLPGSGSLEGFSGLTGVGLLG